MQVIYTHTSMSKNNNAVHISKAQSLYVVGIAEVGMISLSCFWENVFDGYTCKLQTLALESLY